MRYSMFHLRLLLVVATLIPTVGKAVGNVGGTVRDEASLPIASVWVDAYDTGNVRVDSGQSDSAGVYAITNLAAGSYYLLTSASVGNYVNQWYSNVVATSSEIPAAATPVVVAASNITNLDFRLAAGGSISGRVATVSNVALSGVWMDAYDGASSRRASALTDAGGTFILSGLPEGLFYVQTDDLSGTYADAWYNDVPAVGSAIPANALGIAVQAGAVVGPVNFALADGARLAGRVTATAGAGLADVWVDAYTPDGEVAASGLSASNGNFTVGGLAAGAYYTRTFVGAANYVNEWYDDVTVAGFDLPTAQATALTLAAGASVTNVNFVLVPGGTIAGTISNSTGQALGGVWVDVYGSNSVWLRSVQSDVGGAYSAAGLPSGVNWLRTFVGTTNLVDEWYDNVPVAGSGIPAAAAPVAVTTGAVTPNISFRLSAGGVVAGTVTRTNGAALAGVAVDAYDLAANWIRRGTTSAGGAYQIGGLPAPASYVVTTRADAFNVVNEWYRDIPVLGSAIPSGVLSIPVVAGGVTSGIDFALADGARVTGTVRDAGLAALSGVTLALYDWRTNRVMDGDTAGDGSFDLKGLAPDSYALRTEAGALNVADEWYSNVTAVGVGIPAVASRLTLPAGGAITGLVFVLEGGGTVQGVVTEAGATALVAVAVDVYNASTNWLKSGLSDAVGAYRITGVPTQQPVRVRTYVGAVNLVDEWYANIPVQGGGIPAGAQGLSLGTATVSGVDFVLDAGAIVQGAVEDEAASPISGVLVGIYSTNGGLVASGTSDGAGAYWATKLPAGSYYARTFVAPLGFVDEWFDNVRVDGATGTVGAATVGLSVGALTNADFRLGFLLVAARQTNGMAQVFWQAASGTVYQVERSPDLVNWTNAPSGSNVVELSAQTAPAQTVLEYRGALLPGSNASYRVMAVP